MDAKEDLFGWFDVRSYDNYSYLHGNLTVAAVSDKDISGTLKVAIYHTKTDLNGSITINTTTPEPAELEGSMEISERAYLPGTINIIGNTGEELLTKVIVPLPNEDLNGTISIRCNTTEDINITMTVPHLEMDIPGSIVIERDDTYDIPINVRVPENVKPAAYEPIVGSLIIKIPFPYTQFTDTEFFLTESKTNLFIPRRYYERYDEYHLLLSDELGLQEDDEIRFTFCHNDAKFHIQKMEFYFKANGNASYYYLDLIIPYKKRIENTNLSLKVFVNRREIVLNKDYIIDNETGILEFINDNLAQSPDDRIDILCFYTGIDDTAVADLPMSGYIYLKRNMIDRNYNNNLMATFINGKLIPRDKILHISNNIYKIKEDIKTRHDLQILNMSNRIDCMVPFYKQATQYPPLDKYSFYPPSVNIFDEDIKYMEAAMPITITVPELETFGRQKMTIYQNPVYFSPEFLLENKDKYISFIHHASSKNIQYELIFYENDTITYPTNKMKVTLELHIKTPFEETKEESRSTILLLTFPYRITAVYEDYCYACLQIKQIINLDIWNNNFLESCDGITLRIEPNRTYQDQPSEVYFHMWCNKFENFENEQITVFEYRITDKYDGLGNISYSKFLSFNPEETVKDAIRAEENNKV